MFGHSLCECLRTRWGSANASSAHAESPLLIHRRTHGRSEKHFEHRRECLLDQTRSPLVAAGRRGEQVGGKERRLRKRREAERGDLLGDAGGKNPRGGKAPGGGGGVRAGGRGRALG